MDVGIARVDPTSLARRVVRSLGLDPEAVRVDSPTAVAASVRRAASFLCPVPPGALGREVNGALSGLTESPPAEGLETIESVLDSLVTLGDLIELPLEDPGSRSRRHLFLGPPSYVRRAAGCIVLGVRPEGAPILLEGMIERVEYSGHMRFIRRRDESEDLEKMLAGEGLIELSPEHWLKAPRYSSFQELIDQYIARLDAAGGAGDIEGIRMIDPSSDVAFYRARWRAPKRGDSGTFVVRRPQAYGADLWCFAQLHEGKIERLFDLPVTSPIVRGADEGWRLQAAIDRSIGSPQRLRIRRLSGQSPVIDVFSPLPTWHQRRLEFVGARTDRSPGALFSYSVAAEHVAEEVRFLVEMLWLKSEEVDGDDHVR